MTLRIEQATPDQAETVASLIAALLAELSGGHPPGPGSLQKTAKAVLSA